MPLDLDATIALLSRTAEELGGHVRGALDMRRGFSERQASAFAACELIERTGVLAKLGEAKAWIAANRPHLDRAP